MRAAAAFALAMALASPAAAEGQVDMKLCQDLGTIQQRLAKRFNERPVSRGKAAGGGYVVVFASPDGLSFTVVRVMSNGIGCAFASGSGWQPGRLVEGERL